MVLIAGFPTVFTLQLPQLTNPLPSLSYIRVTILGVMVNSDLCKYN